jgi:TPR repeat protein
MYFNGQGVPKDYQTAANYFHQAVDLDNVYSMRFLANMYEVGLLGPPNLQKASELRARAQQLDPIGSQQPESVAFFRRIAAAGDGHHQQVRAAPTRRYVVYRRIRLIGCGWTWC